jgi:hypothetical protein
MEETRASPKTRCPCWATFPFSETLQVHGKNKGENGAPRAGDPTILTNADDATRVTRQLRDELKWIK